MCVAVATGLLVDACMIGHTPPLEVSMRALGELEKACQEKDLNSLWMLYCEISHHKINTATGRKRSKVVQGSSRQRSNKRDNMSQMLLGMSIAILTSSVTVLHRRL